jgi:chaperonin GroES
MQVRPLYDRLLVKRQDPATQTPGGLFLPEAAKEKPFEGVIIAAGTGRIDDDGQLRPLSVKAGDTIVFGKYAGSEIKVDGEDRLILKEDEVLGVISN